MATAYADPEDLGEIEGEAREFDRDAAPWLATIREEISHWRDYHTKMDAIEEKYASFKRLSSMTGEREYQIFWANISVIRPSVYARPPVPVVTPRFKDRKELPRKGAELLERALLSDIEFDDVDTVLQLARDDMTLGGRGVAWLSVKQAQGATLPTLKHLDRKDFLHGRARKWREVPWVAKREHLNRKEMLERFGDIGLRAKFSAAADESGVDHDDDEGGAREKQAEVWELWHKAENLVVWVSDGVEEVLDISEPYFDLEGFFPCPKPAFGTLQPRSLMPVPDYLFYRDQIEEVNEITERIHALSEALVVRGFYAEGSGDAASAIRRSLESTDSGVVLVGLPDLSGLSAGAVSKLVEYWPTEQVANALAQSVQLRKELEENIKEITGISDLMRGETEASETATAQRLKSQYGTVRIRTYQHEMQRFARDCVRLKAEYLAEQAEPETLLLLSQVDDLPPAAQVQQQLAQLQGVLQQAQMVQAQAQQNPQFAQQVQQNPQAMQIAQQLPALQKQAQDLQNTVTLEAVVEMLRSQRLRPFVLDIETDSTIQSDEDAEKQRRTEYLAAVGGFVQQALPMVQQFPQIGPIVVDMIRFAAGGFRAGRDIESTLDEFSETVKEMAAQLQQRQSQPQPGQLKEQAEIKKIEAEAAKISAEAQAVGLPQPGAANDNKGPEMQLRAEEMAQKLRLERDKFMADAAIKEQELEIKRAELAQKIEMADADREQRDRQAMASANASSGLPSDYSFEADRAATGDILQTVMQMLATVQESTAANAAAIQQLAAAQSAPKRIVRNEQGDAVGVETMG